MKASANMAVLLLVLFGFEKVTTYEFDLTAEDKLTRISPIVKEVEGEFTNTDHAWHICKLSQEVIWWEFRDQGGDLETNK